MPQIYATHAFLLSLQTDTQTDTQTNGQTDLQRVGFLPDQPLVLSISIQHLHDLSVFKQDTLTDILIVPHHVHRGQEVAIFVVIRLDVRRMFLLYG